MVNDDPESSRETRASGTDSPRKILFVSTMAGGAWGGSEELWSQTALRLREAGHQVSASVFDWLPVPEPVAALQRAGIEFQFRPRTKPLVSRLLGKISKSPSSGPLDRACMNWLREKSPDLVVISQGFPWDGLAWIQACHELGLPFCPVVHANSEIWWPVDDWMDSITTGYPAARRAFFVSDENMRLMNLQCGFHLENAEVVINPWMADTTEIVPWPDDETTHLACVGRIDPKAKGQDILLQVMAMPKWRERPVHLHIYGGGPCEKSLRKLKDWQGLDNVHFEGHVSDVRGIWERNHALVLPSRYEGLPLVIIEAMLCGRPVITTDVAGNAQYIRDGANGFVAEAPTVALFDRALERAWSARPLWREVGTVARADLQQALPADPIGVFSARLLELTG